MTSERNASPPLITGPTKLFRVLPRKPSTAPTEGEHAKDEEARRFYMKFDFIRSPSDPMHRFVLLKDVRRIASGSSGLVAEGAAEERREEVLGLMQRLPLHGTQLVYSLRHFQESLLVAQVWYWDAHLANLVEVKPRFCLSVLRARDLSLSTGV